LRIGDEIAKLQITSLAGKSDRLSDGQIGVNLLVEVDGIVHRTPPILGIDTRASVTRSSLA
jgi:hypothetical protein